MSKQISKKNIVVVKYRSDKTDADKNIASLGEIDCKSTVKSGFCTGTTTKTPCSGTK